MLKALETPWKITNRLHAMLVHPYVRLLFMLHGIQWGRGWSFYGVPIIQKHAKSTITFGEGLQLRSTVRSNPLGPNHPVIICTFKEGAVIETGENFTMSGGTLCAYKHIKIGNNVGLGGNSTIVDTDFHPIDPKDRSADPQGGNAAMVCIEDNVFVGMNCLILKGVTIGEGSVVGACSVVTRSVPPHVIVAGNPAVVVKKLE